MATRGAVLAAGETEWRDTVASMMKLTADSNCNSLSDSGDFEV